MNNCVARHRVRRRRLITLAVLSLAAACLGLAACGAPAKPAAHGPQALPVEIMPAKATTVNSTTSYVGTLQSRMAATIMPQVTGNISRILVHSGQVVRAGQLLMEINPEKQQATVESDRSAVAAQAATTAYDLEQFHRYQALYKAQVASQEQLNQMQSTYAAAKSQLDSLKAQVAEQEAQLTYYRITAPRSGIVGDIPVHVGDLVTTSTVLTTVNQAGALHVYVYVPVERASALRLGMPLQLLGPDGKVLAATTINFVAPEVNSGSQTVLVKGVVSDQQGRLRNLQYVTARIVWGQHSTILVPVLDVAAINGRYFVFLAVKNPKAPKGYVAQEVPVSVGPVHGNAYEITRGLKPGDLIITSQLQILVAGMPIIPLPPHMPGAGQGGAPQTASSPTPANNGQSGARP